MYELLFIVTQPTGHGLSSVIENVESHLGVPKPEDLPAEKATGEENSKEGSEGSADKGNMVILCSPNKTLFSVCPTSRIINVTSLTWQPTLKICASNADQEQMR